MSEFKRILHNEKGLTLVEILITMSLFSVLALSIWDIMNHTVKSSERIYAKIELVENARIALDFMIDEIRRAQKIKIDYPSSNTILGLEIDGIEGINISSGAGDVEFSLNGNKLKFNDIELVDHIQSVSFEPSSLDQDQNGQLDPELDVNKDGLMDKNLKITIKTIPLKDIPSYEISGEVSIRYKEIASY
ncbi:MAG: hypothetical protein PWP07_2662 [Epulopiscium sp.]|jgi:prepilin-type N-terminal cleavage/methylation domain-containing protein|uniref:Prepilin-type N-terminal cleavage/methylation domain-containing protein n=1 Tax=Defluviitalea raffinosedens TaxID=1450156 RepID=A0A7C8HHD2_9FIRM|nr:prepilin-type N-terminal cleavage/methylation domain-containing protein [Defluviitalea raffinosedens]MBZ4669274.1 hypothetical protein [Defluviitaleaceae bacterium]MDK2789417.1 hypothetical protein [Candidatus Epulonipiscium sp.]KAE9637252.1 prepilin-type N-terminal cleavage/methylation domain-containing protein [Defluviitalea raffinosedens]MBM7685553.1 prepilin-type N-terminal cleavage/methylation domain-containing protein [Defluviitalea raffinosedens]HHW66718.1 prepilin-type N-terminal cl